MFSRYGHGRSRWSKVGYPAHDGFRHKRGRSSSHSSFEDDPSAARRNDSEAWGGSRVDALDDAWRETLWGQDSSASRPVSKRWQRTEASPNGFSSDYPESGSETESMSGSDEGDLYRPAAATMAKLAEMDTFDELMKHAKQWQIHSAVMRTIQLLSSGSSLSRLAIDDPELLGTLRYTIGREIAKVVVKRCRLSRERGAKRKRRESCSDEAAE